MKRISFTAGLVLACYASFSQLVVVNEPDYNKPTLFHTLPATIPVDLGNISSLFDRLLGQTVDINLSDSTSFRFTGEVIELAEKSQSRIRTVIVKSTNYPGARFTVSKLVLADGQVSYRGRIISFDHGDLYELQLLSGKYKLVKRNFYDLVNE